ncbi:hypothetical protein FMUND_956 [Fusarium mundagurra]|uniref:Uncharacterized protein n=1 Tax=Fusarium mundagurra TaxID=1567541 RepID=A0A8H5Z3X1_9HYPO|nr:hypothetical protein FMUND_956 [Fusarium mundagurra]
MGVSKLLSRHSCRIKIPVPELREDHNLVFHRGHLSAQSLKNDQDLNSVGSKRRLIAQRFIFSDKRPQNDVPEIILRGPVLVTDRVSAEAWCNYLRRNLSGGRWVSKMFEPEIVGPPHNGRLFLLMHLRVNGYITEALPDQWPVRHEDIDHLIKGR